MIRDGTFLLGLVIGFPGTCILRCMSESAPKHTDDDVARV